MFITVKQLAEKVNNKQRFTPEELFIETEYNKPWKQWLADVYHCCESWGQTMTEEEMKMMLSEHMKEKFPDDYSPDPVMYKACTAYWNMLCEQYPN